MVQKLHDLIKTKNIQHVLVIDDAYDPFPLAEDLVEHDDEWSIFFNDLSKEQIDIISASYPQYEDEAYENLISDNKFIKIIWDIYQQSPESKPFNTLFSQIDNDRKYDIELLTQLKNLLESLNLSVTTLGRTQLNSDNQFDIVITDLYLHSTQNNINHSIEKIKSIFDSNIKKPLLILMSRSSRLGENSKNFRDQTGLLESMFQVIEKKELIDSYKLHRILKDLIENKDYSHNILQFIEDWEKGIENAAKKSIDILRTIGIAEYTKIKQLLLNAEGESTGNYIVDVMHHVLQYELENEQSITRSASLLNDIQSSSYLPVIRNDTNLQEIVERLHCKNSVNIPPFSDEKRVHFGDILTINNINSVHRSLKNYSLKETDVILAISPACDLQRCNDSYNVIFLKGEKEEFTIKKWIPKADSSRIVKIDKNFYIIKWDTKNPFTFTYKYLKNNLIKGNLKISARLREIPSLSLQQESLAQAGRVGVIAPMPASYNLDLSFFYINIKGELEKINISSNESCFSTIYTSYRTNREKNLNILIISNELCEKLHQAIDKLDINNHIHSKSRNAFNLIKKDLYLETLIRHKGINAPVNTPDCAIRVDNKIIGYVTNKTDQSTTKKEGLIICLNTG